MRAADIGFHPWRKLIWKISGSTRSNWSVEQADRYHHDLVDAIEGLARGVKTGRRTDVREGYFKYPVGQHVVFFRQSEAVLDVIRILHQRMDVERHL